MERRTSPPVHDERITNEQVQIRCVITSRTLQTKNGDPMKIAILAVGSTLFLLAGQAIAQTAAKKSSAKAAAGGPTKVTGEPIKTASGLEYWDIKVGTGAVAQTGKHVKVDYTGWLTDGKNVGR